MRIAVGLETGRRRFRQLQGRDPALAIVMHRALACMAGPEQFGLLQPEGLGHGVALRIGQGGQTEQGLATAAHSHQGHPHHPGQKQPRNNATERSGQQAEGAPPERQGEQLGYLARRPVAGRTQIKDRGKGVHRSQRG